MDKIIAEVVVSALVLAMLIMVIPIYNSNVELAKEAACVVDYNENIKEVTAPEVVDKSIISGSDVISIIRYYGLKGGMLIKVIQSSTAHTYSQQSNFIYDKNIYEINRELNFLVTCIYTDDDVTAILFKDSV